MGKSETRTGHSDKSSHHDPQHDSLRHVERSLSPASVIVAVPVAARVNRSADKASRHGMCRGVLRGRQARRPPPTHTCLSPRRQAGCANSNFDPGCCLTTDRTPPSPQSRASGRGQSNEALVVRPPRFVRTRGASKRTACVDPDAEPLAPGISRVVRDS